MAQINPYLTFNGNCEAAFNLYKSVFGKEFSYIGRFNEMPSKDENAPLPEEDGNKIMHVSLPISEETTLFGSDSSEAFDQSTIIGNNISISINASSIEEADQLFNGLSEGGIVKMPMKKTFWGAYFGMFTDKFEINWMINYDEPQVE
jgi:PhnB protein